MIVRVLLPPDASRYIEFKDADDFYFNDNHVTVVREYTNYNYRKKERVLGCFSLKNIIGIVKSDECETGEKDA